MKPFRILCSLDLSQVGILIGHAILTEQEIPGGRWRHQSRRQRQVLLLVKKCWPGKWLLRV